MIASAIKLWHPRHHLNTEVAGPVSGAALQAVVEVAQLSGQVSAIHLVIVSTEISAVKQAGSYVKIS